MTPNSDKVKGIKRMTRCGQHLATLSEALTQVAQRLMTDCNVSIGVWLSQ